MLARDSFESEALPFKIQKVKSKLSPRRGVPASTCEIFVPNAGLLSLHL